MLLTKWSHLERTARQVGLFLLLLLDVALTEDTEESSDEVNGNVADPTIDPYMTTKEYNWNVMRSTPFPNLQYKSRAVLRSFLIRHMVIPDVLAVAPSYIMEVVYSRRSVVNLGNKMDPALLQKIPRSIVWPWNAESFYTLVLVDPDVPKRTNPVYAQRVHWLVVNIPGNNLMRGEQVVEYMGPVAPPHTGMHRYVFAVFRQFARLHYEESILKAPTEKFSTERLYFSLRNFSMKYKLRDPIAMNFYLSGWPLDQHVPEAQVPTRKPWTTTMELPLSTE